MGKQTARPVPAKETAKKETGKQEGALKDSDLEDVAGAGVGSSYHQDPEAYRQSGPGFRIIRIPGN